MDDASMILGLSAVATLVVVFVAAKVLSGAPVWAKLLGFGVIAAVLLGALLVATKDYRSSPPSTSSEPDGEGGSGARPPSGEPAGSGGPPSAGSEPPAEAEEPTRGLEPPKPAPPPPTAPAPPPSPITAPPPAPTAPPPTDGVLEQNKEDWDVVPVFYGTDRVRTGEAGSIDYNNERGRRLEVGRALVTIPKSHKVPQIERPWSIRIPYFDITIGESEDPNSHFTMKEVKPLTQDEFLTLVRERIAASQRYKKHALIFVHGFNTAFDYALFRTAQISYDLKFDGAPFCYSWPSGGGLASYTFDRERSGQSAKFLREFMEMVVDKTGAESVSVIAHSMGNQPLLEVLKDLKAARPANVVFNQIILAAPDVDRDSFGDITAALKGLAKNITLYASSNDTALAISRNVNGGPRAGDIPQSGPLVLPGIDTLDVTNVSTDGLGINHSGYAENNKLLKDIGKLVSTGKPPSERLPVLEVVPLGNGKYWRFPKVIPEDPEDKAEASRTLVVPQQ